MTKKVNIAIDAMSGENSPKKIIDGINISLESNQENFFFLYGQQDLLEKDYAIGEVVDKHCQKLGLLVRPFINICIISPPLIITKKEIDNLVSILRKGLELTMRDLEEIGVSL